jgi:hypothetical protein
MARSTSTTLKMVSQEHLDNMMLNAPMKASDAASMMRRQIGNNDRPYDVEVYKANNAVVDSWYNDVLLKIADSTGNVPAGRVGECLRYYLEGRDVKKYMELKSQFPSYTEGQVEFWVNKIRSSSVTELHDVGAFNLHRGWDLIQTYLKDHFAQRKWDDVYSRSDDPCTQDRYANDNPHLMNGRPLPTLLVNIETLKDMQDKVMTVLRNPIQPR